MTPRPEDTVNSMYKNILPERKYSMVNKKSVLANNAQLRNKQYNRRLRPLLKKYSPRDYDQ